MKWIYLEKAQAVLWNMTALNTEMRILEESDLISVVSMAPIGRGVRN